MQYVDLKMVAHIAMILAASDKFGIPVTCEEFEVEEFRPCGKRAGYLVPDATRAGGGGQDVELRPAMFCREHLEEMLGHAPAEQPIFRRLEGPGE